MADVAPTLLVILLALPIVAAGVVAALGPHNASTVRTVSLATVLVCLAITILVVIPAAAE